MAAPQNTVQVQGQGAVSADYLNSLVQWVSTVAVLRTFVGTSTMTVFLLGINAVNDGGQGVFYWNSTSTAPDDGHNVIVPSGALTGAWIRADFVASVIFPSGGTTSAQCGANYVFTAAGTLQLAASTSSSKACVITAFAYGGAITVSLAAGTDKINGGTAGVSLTVPQGYSTTISTDAAGNYYATVILSAAATGGTTSTGISGVSGLQINNNVGAPNTKIDITAATVYIASSSLQVRFASFTTTIDASTSGVANGIDTGSLAASTWYFVYIIAGISSGSVIKAGLISLSSTTPTLPTGYTLAYRVGAYRTDGSTHFYGLKQLSNFVQYTLSNPTVPIVLTSGVHGNPSTPTWFAVSVSNVVPSTAASIALVLEVATNGMALAIAPNGSYTVGAYAPIYVLSSASSVSNQTAYLLLESSNVYYASNDANATLWSSGWIDNL